MGDYVSINGHPTWVDDRGRGDPVMLLHGAFENSDDVLECFAPLGDQHRLVAFDRRGHGRTADTEADFHYADMATETIGVLDHVVGGPAHLVGYSDGANVALLVARQRADRVRSLVLIGANYSWDGVLPGVLDVFTLDSPVGSMLLGPYAERSPDGAEHFPVIMEKTMRMLASEPTMTEHDLAGVTAPALVLVGDDDLMSLSHTCSLYESLPAGQLAVVPAASHLVVFEKTELVNHLILEFLTTDGPPATMMPVRRA